MNEDLFFLPEITRALQQPDPARALREAFDRIQIRGKSFQRGYRQFLHFMISVRRSREETGPNTASILIERERTVLAVLSFEASQQEKTAGGVIPGPHRVKTETGLLLWQGLLREEDLLWKKAYPGQPLKLAADTGEPSGPPTRTLQGPGGVNLEVYAGIESGFMKISLKKPEIPS